MSCDKKLFLRLQISQKPVKGAFVRIVFFPSCKISDVTLTTNIPGPADGAVHHGFIQTNRKQNILLLDPFTVEGVFYLMLYPIALDGVLG